MSLRSGLLQRAACGLQALRAWQVPRRWRTVYRPDNVVLTDRKGLSVLNDPLLNKGTAYSDSERCQLGLRGLVPPKLYHGREVPLALQARRILKRLRSLHDPINKYQMLVSLQDRNETLFFKILSDNLEELAPIVYTPTVGTACLQSATVFRRSRGLYFSSRDVGEMHEIVYNWPDDVPVELVCVTDGSRILGLGDLGINGFNVIMGKLALYTACGGLHSRKLLPVFLDVGTNNPDLLEDPYYLGNQHPRLRGAEYDAVVDEFVAAIKSRWPNCLLHFEDFQTENAARLLDNYKRNILCFNDDIQGTGAVTVSAVLSALRLRGFPDPQALTDETFVIAGAGSAGLGIGDALLSTMKLLGLGDEAARARFTYVDAAGSLGAGREVQFEQQDVWVRHDLPNGMSLEETVNMVKPSALIGVTGCRGLFTEGVVRAMASHNSLPLLFPLSNPTSKAECTFEDAMNWTNGRALFASGSPFAPVQHDGRTVYASQANNMFIFPALGLGSVTVKPSLITTKMLFALSSTLAQALPTESIQRRQMFPPIRDILSLSVKLAFAFCKAAYEEDLATVPFVSDDDLMNKIEANVWRPEYARLLHAQL